MSADRSSLDIDSSVAQLAIVGPRYGWSLTLVPAAREGGGCFGRLGGNPERAPSGGSADPERSAAEAARRARTKTRRYIVANRLNRFGTLTYDGAGCHEPAQVKSDMAEFWRNLRRLLAGGHFPYLWTAEWHPGGHGLHIHFVIDRYVKRDLIAAAWGWKTIPGRGFVHIKIIGDMPVGSTVVDEARRVAGYLSKYVAKDFDAESFPKGWHRYEVAQGFQPDEVRVFGRSELEVLDKASAIMGCRPVNYWSSTQDPNWGDRPAAVWVQWPG